MRSADCVQAVVAGETVLMSADSGTCYALDGVGSFLWKLLAHPILIAALQQSCRDTYQGAADHIDADVLEWMAEMKAEGLIVECEPT